MSFKRIDEYREKSTNLKIETYKHDIHGLCFVYVEDENCQFHTTINITVKTPVINNSGVSHVVEHCIASEFDSSSLIKSLAHTSLDRTSYELVVESSKYSNFKKIFSEIFFPKFKDDIHIFLREGWRSEEDKIKGIVFDEIKESYTNPLYLIMNETPSSLYKDIHNRCFAGGSLERLLSLTYEEVLRYHDSYYRFDNCCVYVYGNGCRDALMKALLKVMSEKPDVQKQHLTQGILSKEPFNERIIKTVSYESDSGEVYISNNFKVKNPKNRFEYNLYKVFSDFLTNDHYGILNNTYSNERKSNYLIKSGLKNLSTPYFTVILGSCSKEDIQDFEDILNNSIKHSIDKICDIKEIPDYIGNHLCSNGNIDSKAIGTYVMEAFILKIPLLSYLKIVEDSDDINNEGIQNLYDTFINNHGRSTVVLKPKKEIIKNKDYVIEENKKIAPQFCNYSIKELKAPPLGLITLDNKTNKFMESTGALIPKERVIEGINAYTYKGDFPANKVMIYFKLSELGKENIISLNLVTKYMNQLFYEKYQDQSSKCYLRVLSDNLLLVLSVVYKNSENLNKIKQFYEVFLNLNDEKIHKLKEQLRMAYKVDIRNSAINYLTLRQKAYFSIAGFYEDLLKGIGNYYGLDNFNTDYRKMLCKPFVSIYSKEPEEDLRNVTSLLKEMKYCKSLKSSKDFELIKDNEGFILPSHLSNLALGCNLKHLNEVQQVKLNIICNVMMKMHLSKELREKNNVYASSFMLKNSTLIFSTIKDPNIVRSIEIFEEIIKFLRINTNSLLSMIKKINIENIRAQNHIIDTWENDFSTLKRLFPTNFECTSSIVDFVVSAEELEELSGIMQQAIASKRICIIGNELEMQKNANLFQSIKYI